MENPSKVLIWLTLNGRLLDDCCWIFGGANTELFIIDWGWVGWREIGWGSGVGSVIIPSFPHPP